MIERERGRPPKYKKDMIADAELLSRLGFTQYNLCTYWGITPRSLARWKKRHPELSQAIKQGKLHANLAMTKALYNKGIRGDVTAMKYWLNNQGEGWSEKGIQVNINQLNAKGDININSVENIRNVINQFTQEEKVKLYSFIKDFNKEKKEHVYQEGLITSERNSGE